MPKNEVSDLITDQEIAFALLILSGTMNDQRAAEAVGLNPATAAYIKSKPCVRAYMLEHRAVTQQQLVEQQAESIRPLTPRREQVLARLWELANLSSEMTRCSITGQVKALSMIVAIEGLIPDRRARSAQNEPVPPPIKPQIYESEWLREQKAKAAALQPNPAPQAQEDREEDKPGVPQAEPAPASEVAASPDPGPIFDTKAQWVPDAGFAPDTRAPFSIKKNPFARRR
jgi:hypothetical protein